ncbi:MAG: response regulator [Desulfobacterales bacterium]
MINILIADDDAAARKMISQYLKKKATVFEAANGIEAYTAIIEQSINIAIIDWVLPGMEGIEVCRNIGKNEKKAITSFSLC